MGQQANASSHFSGATFVPRIDRVLGDAKWTVDEFVDRFPVFVEASGGVNQLRTCVFDLAIRGRLTQRSGPEKEDGGPRRATADDDNGEPFALPPEWSWASLKSLASLINGDRSKNYPSKAHRVAKGIPFINAGHLREGRVDLAEMDFINQERFDLLRSGKVQNGDILYCLRGSLGKAGLVANMETGAIASSLVIVRVEDRQLLANYLLLVFDSSLGAAMIKKYDNGTAQPNLSATDVGKYTIPLPALAEQKRIVARVDQLMALIDELEAKQIRKREVGTRFTKASLEALTTAEGLDEFNVAWKRVVENWATVIDRPEKVAEIRLAIIDLASRGRLGLPKSKSKSAHEALQKREVQREAEWRRLEAAKRERSGTRAKMEYVVPEFPFPENLPPLPNDWAYAPIGLLGADHFAPVQTGPFGAQLHSSEFVPTGVPVIAVGNLTGTGFTTDGLYFITKEKAAQLARYDVQGGDLLFARSGATLGKVCVAPASVNDWRMTGHILRVRLEPQVIRAELAALWLWAGAAVKEQVLSTIRGGTRPGYNTSLLESIVIPIPPIDQQDHLLARVSDLMKLCDELEAKLRRAEDRASRLVEAVVQEMVA